ncbi:butyrophilin-like protein 1 [Sparus aurata]|uniref:butyrophilin-like protein 1 n=1 Tax=Sparus aurata TaxID=8175 RepID=UPI0011C1BEA3|nr:butyrophilin-like protein 1 [Sparus aurata]
MDVNAETIEWTRPDLGQRFVHVRRSALHTSSVPVISLSGIDRNKGEVILNCDSNSWYPEPEVFWLDGEGNLLSAGPTETVRGPDDLYTVSSRVTVEKRHSNSFICRVQQNHINQIRETLIFISEDFFEVLSSSSSTTVILAVTLAVCILVILILGLYVRRQKKSTEKKQKGEVLTKEEEKPMKMKKKDEMKMIKKERQDKEKAQSKVRMLKDQLESKIKEVEHEKDKVRDLTEEKKRSEEKQQKLQTNIKQVCLLLIKTFVSTEDF